MPVGTAAEPIADRPMASEAGNSETPAQKDSRMKWWRDAKFGMFIHWGVYAVPARKGEWVMLQEKIPVATYRQFAKEFNPVKFNPDEWADIASDAGMKYMVITAKHHDGFALYPSSVTDWNIADATPYKKDVLGPLRTAAKKKGIRFGLYYSQSQDWTHPGGAKHQMKEGEGWDDAHKGSYDRYLQTIALPQARELITRYQPDILWWDTPRYMTRERAEPFAELCKLQPGMITNNRLGGGFEGDTKTPEQKIPKDGCSGDWETCMTIGEHWGYVANDKKLKSSEDLIRKLADVCSKGGNFLLNVGPTKEGVIPEYLVERLRAVGKWLKANGESIYDTQAGPFNPASWGCATRKGDCVYLHVLAWPANGTLSVPLENKTAEAWTLANPESKLTVTSKEGHFMVSLPGTAPDPADSVIVLKLQGKPLPLVSATSQNELAGAPPLH